ncbi:MAG TPA: hypothetical protein VNJ01_09525 [Bacteriovoracaceae bacterium]|nr:hypothetical protein [Bacteriovoracaceae bacterium]
MKFYLLITMVLVISCGDKNPTSVIGAHGNNLIETHGDPIRIDPLPLTNSSMFIYPGNRKFQLQNNTVTNSYRDPQGDETTVLFWKHKFKKCQTELVRVMAEKPSHRNLPVELRCPDQGIGVIFSEGSDLVSRVVEFEKE